MSLRYSSKKLWESLWDIKLKVKISFWYMNYKVNFVMVLKVFFVLVFKFFFCSNYDFVCSNYDFVEFLPLSLTWTVEMNNVSFINK